MNKEINRNGQGNREQRNPEKPATINQQPE